MGHFYSLNLRTQLLEHLAAGQGLHEHDMSALKRIKPKGLRQRVPKGKRVICIYDKAGIDFRYWKRCRQECAVYFLSRVKANMVYDWLESVPWDEADPRNAGVTEDRRPCHDTSSDAPHWMLRTPLTVARPPRSTYSRRTRKKGQMLKRESLGRGKRTGTERHRLPIEV